MQVITGVSEDGKEKGMFAGLAIGSVVGLEAMFAGPICGASDESGHGLLPRLSYRAMLNTFGFI